MNFIPVGRYLLIEPIIVENVRGKKKKPQVLLPESYEPNTVERFKVCRVVKVGPECGPHITANTLAVVNNSMVEKIKVFDTDFYVILENHAVGVVNE